MGGDAAEQLRKGISERRVWPLLQFLSSQSGGQYLKMAPPRPEFLGVPSAVGHAIIIARQPGRDAKHWEAEVRKMITVFGAPISDADVRVIVDYLSSA